MRLLTALSLLAVACATSHAPLETTSWTGKVEALPSKYRDELNRIVQLIGEKQFDEALPVVEGILQRCAAAPADASPDPGCGEAFKHRSFIHSEHKEFGPAEADLARASAILPNDPVIGCERGYLLTQLRRPAEAAEVYRDVIARAGAREPVRAVALRGLGVALIELDQLDEAERALNQSLEIAPDHPVALNELKYIEQVRAKRR
jgi:tetratricopeptide (TPR) repeat protein